MATSNKQDNDENTLLRFMVGDDVFFRIEGNVGWQVGTVEELWYRNSKWPDKKRSCPYRLKPTSPDRSSISDDNNNNNNNIVIIERDTDAYIRPSFYRRSPKLPLLCGDVPLPEPKDPLDYLFKPFPTNAIIQSFSAVDRWAKDNGLVELETLKDIGKDGSIITGRKISTASLGRTGNKTSKECPSLLVPSNLAVGQEYRQENCSTIVGYIANRIRLRRPLYQDGEYNAEQLYDSLFPKESSFEELQNTVQAMETSRHLDRCRKLLNLGDAHLYLHRAMQCDRNFSRGRNCYLAAALNVSEKEASYINENNTSGGIPMGLPEAMTAMAMVVHFSAEKFLYAKMNHLNITEVPTAPCDRPMLEVDQIIASASSDPVIKANVFMTMSHLVNALDHGWYSSLAFLYGKALNSGISLAWSDPSAQRSIQVLQMAHRHNKVKNRVQQDKLRESCVTRYGVPSKETISMFAPKAEDILRSLPLHYYSPETPCEPKSLHLHISFFQLLVPSRPVCLLVSCPITKVIEILRIPDEHQLFPFSDDCFQWLWNRIAYMVHLGLRKSDASVATSNNPYEIRVRPKTFQLKNVGGDLQFAFYLQQKCFQLPGTQVEIIEVDDIIEDETGIYYGEDDWKSISSGIQQLEKEEAIRKSTSFFTMLMHSSESPLGMLRSLSSNLVASVTEEAKVVESVKQIKKTGNLKFGQSKYELARKHYVTGISELRRIMNPSNSETFSILGTLLSNYSLCGLEIAKTQTPAYGTFTLKQVIAGCDVALTNPRIYEASSEAVQAKIQFRKDLALSRQPANDPTIVNRCDELRDDNDSKILHVDVQYNLRLFREETQGQREDRHSPDKIIIALGKDIKNDDEKICPLCYDDFLQMLAKKYILKLPCGHIHCAKCFLQWKHSGQRKSEMHCALCRKQVLESQWEEVLEEIAKTSFKEKKVDFLPLDSPADRLEVFRVLLIKHHLDLDAVSDSLDDMSYLNNCGNMWQLENLSWKEKEGIYNRAQLPVQRLSGELEEAQAALDKIKLETIEGAQAQAQEKVAGIKEGLRLAKQNAAAEVYHQMNQSGSMGKLCSEGEIQLDFHGLHVKEAKAKLEEVVLPVLPVVESLVVITGRGKHSANHSSALAGALQKHVKVKHPSIGFKRLASNCGAFRVSKSQNPVLTR